MITVTTIDEIEILVNIDHIIEISTHKDKNFLSIIGRETGEDVGIKESPGKVYEMVCHARTLRRGE